MKKLLVSICILLSLQAISQTTPCDSIPSLNKEIIKYVDTKLHKKVGNGECWTLAAEALNTVNAKWDGQFTFGDEVNWEKECIYPGDIIQFKNVTVKYKDGNTIITEKMPQHTAIIYEVKGEGDFVLANQNVGGKKKVVLTPLDMKNITKGKYHIYRPVN